MQPTRQAPCGVRLVGGPADPRYSGGGAASSSTDQDERTEPVLAAMEPPSVAHWMANVCWPAGMPA